MVLASCMDAIAKSGNTIFPNGKGGTRKVSKDQADNEVRVLDDDLAEDAEGATQTAIKANSESIQSSSDWKDDDILKALSPMATSVANFKSKRRKHFPLAAPVVKERGKENKLS